MPAEKRASLRIPLSVSVTYWVDQQQRIEPYQVDSVNVGEGGIFLKTGIPLGIGTRVKLEFSLPGSAETYRISGEVVWSGSIHKKSEAAVSGKGIRFLDPDPLLRKRLFELLKQEP
ncbi:MAG: PilZ domain-containing protein [bacterium]